MRAFKKLKITKFKKLNKVELERQDWEIKRSEVLADKLSKLAVAMFADVQPVQNTGYREITQGEFEGCYLAAQIDKDKGYGCGRRIISSLQFLRGKDLITISLHPEYIKGISSIAIKKMKYPENYLRFGEESFLPDKDLKGLTRVTFRLNGTKLDSAFIVNRGMHKEEHLCNYNEDNQLSSDKASYLGPNDENLINYVFPSIEQKIIARYVQLLHGRTNIYSVSSDCI